MHWKTQTSLNTSTFVIYQLDEKMNDELINNTIILYSNTIYYTVNGIKIIYYIPKCATNKAVTQFSLLFTRSKLKFELQFLFSYYLEFIKT